MTVTPTIFPDVKLITPRVFPDDRGHFFELYKESVYKEHGIGPFVQDNVSHSKKGVLRGLHFQNPNPQGKLVCVLEGSIYDVVVDVRVGSPTFGKWYGVELTADPPVQLWVPEGYAHGFISISDGASVIYKCTTMYSPHAEHTLLWNDGRLGIEWRFGPVLISPKDVGGRTLEDLASARVLPTF